jgi:hypothetical protein
MQFSRPFRPALLAIVFGAGLGVAGFTAGFLGNSLLAQDPGTVAPLVGIFFTGPLELLLGVVCGAMFGFSTASVRTVVLSFFACVMVTVVASLALSAPEFKPEARIADVEVTRCEPVASLVPSRTAHWQQEAARVSREGILNISPAWELRIAPMVASRPGVVLTCRTRRVRWIEQRIWRGGYTQTRATSWKEDPQVEQFFSDDPSECKVQAKHEKTYLLCYERSASFPPTTLPEYLGLWVAHPIASSTDLSRHDLLAHITGLCH